MQYAYHYAMTRDMRLLFSRAHRTTTRYFQDRAAEEDLSIVQAQALMVIDVNPGINVGTLAATLSKDQASTSIVVDKLMGLGLLTRETDPEDRRRAQLFLTPQAKPIVHHVEGARDDINRLVFDALGSERAQALEALLQELLEAIEGSEARGTV
jgi:DNA-binding MarR family transcriptional regulator